MINKYSQKGFAMPVIIAIIALVVVIGGVGYFATKKQPQITSNAQTSTGEKTLADGTIVKADGTMVKLDGTMVKPDGTMVKPDGTMVKPDGTMVKPDGTMVKTTSDTKGGETMVKAGSYEAYSPEKIAMASATHNVVLFFHASWCPTCRALDADIKSHLKDIPANLTILDVDYDTSATLKQKYGVTVQHTLVEVDAKGNLIKKWLGSPTLSSLVSEVK